MLPVNITVMYMFLIQVLFEDETQNKLRESIALFENIITYPWFQEAAIILLLNNTDLFHEKIARSNLAIHFPAYKGWSSLQNYYDFTVITPPTSQHFIGPPGDPETAKQFLLQLFLNVNPDPENKQIFAHFTQATDAEIFKRVFQDVREHNTTVWIKRL